MRFVSKATLWIGVLVALVGVGIWVWGGSIALQQYLALDALRSAPVDNPLVQFSIAGLALLLGGFLWGLGLGLSRRDKAAGSTPPATTPLPPGNPHARDPVLPPDREPTPPAA